MEFREYNLEELIDKYDNKRKPLSTIVRNGMEKIYPYYGANGIIDYVNDYIFDGNYLLIAEDGTVLTDGKYPVIYKVDGKFWVSNHAHVFKARENIVIQDYLYYALRATVIADKITGSTQLKLSQENMNKIIVKVPSIDNQKKIVKILKSFDDRIENELDLAKTIHEMMQDYFNNMNKSIEEGEESSLSEIAMYLNGIAMQNYRPVDEKESLPVIKIKEMNSGLSKETERCSLDIDNNYIINNGDVLFAWSGTLCVSIWFEGKAGLNQHIFKVSSDKYPKWFYYFWTLKHLQEFINIAKGKATTMGHIKRNELERAKVIVPSSEMLNKANRIMEPLLDEYINKNVEVIETRRIRDELLFRIMGGEVELA